MLTIAVVSFLQRLIEARRMMDKLRACIVANYYASAGLLKAGEVKTALGITRLQGVIAKEGVEFTVQLMFGVGV